MNTSNHQQNEQLLDFYKYMANLLEKPCSLDTLKDYNYAYTYSKGESNSPYDSHIVYITSSCSPDAILETGRIFGKVLFSVTNQYPLEHFVIFQLEPHGVFRYIDDKNSFLEEVNFFRESLRKTFLEEIRGKSLIITSDMLDKEFTLKHILNNKKF